MRLARYELDGRVFVGAINGDQVTRLLEDDGGGRDLLGRVISGEGAQEGATDPLAAVRLLSPLSAPGKILCIGLNYRDHCRETNTPIPDHPVLFAKFANALAGPGDTVSYPSALTQQVDFEAELAVVIGRRGRDVAEGDALHHVFGYTVANDISARDLQFADSQWIRGKALDGFCPLGPVVVTADEVRDPQALALRTTVNERVMQDSNTAEMIFPVAHIIHHLSQSLTLEPGDLILTGTPFGVGMARQPTAYLRDGDIVRVEVEGIGMLENTIRAL